MNRWLVGHFITPALELAFSRPTMACYRMLRVTQWWPQEALRRHQLAKLRRLLCVLLPRLPWYARWAGVDPAWPESLADLTRLPLMDKATLNDHREELVNRHVPGGPIRYRTGGSTGQPLVFYLDRRRQAFDKAARMRSHEWFGILPGDREAYVWGSPVELAAQDRLKRLRDWLTNEWLLPACELSERSISRFLEQLRRFRPRCLFGYPSAMTLLCQLAEHAGLGLHELPIRVAFSTAEPLYEHQRQTISRALGGAPVANGYGSREAGFICHECPQGRMHVTSESVIVEILRDGQPAAPGEDGEIVVTHLDNYAMPFLRYRTGDVGQWSDQPCPCGRGLEVMSVVKGRTNDFVLTPDGRWVHGSGINSVLTDIPGLLTYQVLQRADYSLQVLLVTDGRFPPDGPHRITAGLRRRLGEGVVIALEHRQAIPPGPSGKYRYIISELTGPNAVART